MTLDNGIGLNEDGHIVSRFNYETKEWEAVEVNTNLEALDAMTHPINIRDKEGNPVIMPDNLRIEATNNVPTETAINLWVSPDPFYPDVSTSSPLIHPDGRPYSATEVLEETILKEITEYLRWGREINASNIQDENIGIFFALDINTGMPILDAEGTIQMSNT